MKTNPKSRYSTPCATRWWMARFRAAHLRRTGLQYVGTAVELRGFMNCNYMPESAVYELTGVGCV